MVNIHSSGGTWEFNPGDEILNSKKAADLKKKLQDGVSISLSRRDGEQVITKSFTVKAHFLFETIEEKRDEPWEQIADKTHIAFQDFVKGIIDSGMMDPLLIDNPLTQVPVTRMNLSFSRKDDKLEYQQHRYYDNIHTDKSIEELSDDKYRKASAFLHQNDEKRLTQFSHVAQQASRIQTVLKKQQLLGFEPPNPLENLIKGLSSISDETSLASLLKENAYEAGRPLSSLKQIIDEHEMPEEAMETLSSLLIERLKKGVEDNETKELMSQIKTLELLDNYLCKYPLEGNVISSLALAEIHQLPKFLQQSEAILKDVDAKQLCGYVKDSLHLLEKTSTFKDQLFNRLSKEPLIVLTSLREEAKSGGILSEGFYKLALNVYVSGPEDGNFEVFSDEDKIRPYALAVELLSEKYDGNFEDLRNELSTYNLTEEDVETMAVFVQVAGVEKELRKYPTSLSGIEKVEKIVTDPKSSSVLKEELLIMLQKVTTNNPELRYIGMEGNFHIKKFVNDMLNERELSILEAQQAMRPYEEAFEYVTSCKLDEMIGQYEYQFNNLVEIAKEQTATSKEDQMLVLKAIERNEQESKELLTFLKYLKVMENPGAPEEVRKAFIGIMEKMNGALTECRSTTTPFKNPLSEDITVDALIEGVTFNMRPVGMFETCSEGLLRDFSLTDLKEVNEIISHWEDSRLIHVDKSEKGKEYTQYIHKVALCMQQYQKDRRSLHPSYHPLSHIANLRKELATPKLQALIPSEDGAFIETLLHQDYRLDYYQSGIEDTEENRHPKDSKKTIDPPYIVEGSKYTLDILQDGNCAVNSFLINILGLIHEGRYPEEELLVKLKHLDKKGEDHEDIYLSLRDLYTIDKPFDKLFNKKSKKEEEEAIKEVQKAFPEIFRALLIEYYESHTEDKETSSRGVFQGVKFERGDLAIEVPNEVPYQVGEHLKALNNGLFLHFRAGVNFQGTKSTVQDFGEDLFKYSPDLCSQAMRKGEEWYARLSDKRKEELKIQPEENRGQLLDQWLEEDISYFQGEWLSFLKTSHKTYLNDMGRDKTWLHTLDLGALGELFSTPDIRLNVLLHIETDEYKSTIMTKNHFGKFSTKEFSELELGFLRNGELEVISENHFVECPRQHIIRLFEMQIVEGEGSLLAKKLRKDEIFKAYSEKELIDYMRTFKKRVLEQYDLNYLKSGGRHKKPSLVTMGIFYWQSHFESLVSQNGRFDLTNDGLSQIETGRVGKQASYDDLDRWEELCEKAELLLNNTQSREQVQKILAELSHKIFSLGGEENCPKKLINIRDALIQKL